MRKKYTIAGLTIKVSGAKDSYFMKKMNPYSVCTLKKADINARVIKTDNFIDCEYSPVKKISESQYFYEGDNSDVIIFYDEKLSRTVAKIEFDKTYTEILITLCNLKKLCMLNQDMFLFNIFGIAVQYFIRMKNGFVFHSSAISVNKKGVAFSAGSGVGKSTHTSLWLENVSGTEMINDDTPIIRVMSDKNVYVFGTPWAGTSGINKNIGVPLGAVVFVNRAETNSIHEVSAVDVIRLFLDGVRPSLTKEMHINSLDSMQVIMKSVKMYSLFCNASVEAVHTVRNKLVNDGGIK